MESLFSLEVVINYVKVINLNPNHYPSKRIASCLFPSVAFRLLDYPTIAINLLDNYDAKELKAKLNISEPFEMIEKLPCFTELLDKHGRYIFSKGKSCLFRCDIDTLRGHLRNAPMYLMLLDTYFEPYKLIGTSLVPLTTLINDIYEETYETNSGRVDVPCSRMTSGVIEIKNLMGEEIGHISFACRLTSFGNSLLPHIDATTTEASQRRLKEAKAIDNAHNKKNEETKTINKEIEHKLEEAQETLHYNLKQKTTSSSNTIETMAKSDALIQTVKIDYKDAQIQISDYPNSGKKDKSTQSPQSKRKYPIEKVNEEKTKTENIYNIKHVQDEFAFNHYCPPPLHYNSKNDTQLTVSNNTAVTMILNQNVYINKRVEYLSEVAREFDEEIVDDKNENESLKCLSGEVDETDSRYFIEKPQLVKRQGEFNFDQMPLLKCLFDEMTKLKSLIENKDTHVPKNKMQNKSMDLDKSSNSNKNVFVLKNKPTTELIKSTQSSTQLVGILRKTTSTTKMNTKSKKSNRQHLIDSVNRLSQPRTVKSSNKSPTKSLSSSIIDFDEIPVGKNSNTPIIPKKEPLKYGLTKAHRMRVLASRPDLMHQLDISLKHEKLLEKVKSNLDNLSLTSSAKNEETMHKNLERVLFDTAESTWNNSNLQKNTARSPSNLSLLNKVEMESTYDTMHNTVLLGQNFAFDEEEEEDNEPDVGINSESSSSLTQQQAKMVQFGNTTHHRYTTNSTSAQPTTTTSQATSTPTNSSNSKNNESNDMLNDTKNNQYEEEDNDDEYISNNRNIFLEQNQKNPYDDDFHSSLDSSLTSSTKHSTSTSNFFTAAISKNQTNESPRSSKSSPRLSPRRYLRKDEQPAISENDEEYDEIEYLGQTNQSLKTSSKYSISNDYHMKSYTGDSLSLSKDTNDSFR